uniref:Uncharacterized protein n=2 Tax=Schistocephalus solidus TaxID=70667 RepID=A0A0X3QB07_SCHSO
MSFESFIRLAEKNQAKNDKQVEKLAVELKQRREMLRKELNAARESSILERKSLIKTSNDLSSQKVVVNPQPTPYFPQKRAMVDSEPLSEDSEMSLNPKEYVPSAPKRPSSPSNLMEALAVMNSTGPSGDKLPKPPYVPRIPRIPRKNSEQPINTTLGSTRSPIPTPKQSVEQQRSRAPSSGPSNNQKSLHKVSSMDRISQIPKPSTNVAQPVNSNPSKPPVHRQPKSDSSGVVPQRSVPYRVTINPSVGTNVAYKPTSLSTSKPEKVASTKTTACPPSKFNDQPKSLVSTTKSNSSAARPAMLSNKTQENPPKLLNKVLKNGGIAAQLGTSKLAVQHARQPLSSSISLVKTQQPTKVPTGIAAQLSSKAPIVLEKKRGTQDTIAPYKAHVSPAISKNRTHSTCTQRSSTDGKLMVKPSKPPVKQNGQVSHPELSTVSKKTTVHSVLKSGDEKSISGKSCPPSSQKLGLPGRKVTSQLPSHSVRGIAAQQGAPVRGIAAQFGSLPLPTQRARSPDDYSCDEGDDYASDDSFIDDSESMGAKDYSRFVKVIHKTLNFDPKRYANVSRYDDLSNMESDFRQIEKEERIR